MLKIPKYSIQIPLLVVGKPAEPNIQIPNPKVQFGIIPYGEQKQLEIELVNNESESYNYAVRLPKSLSNAFEAKIVP